MKDPNTILPLSNLAQPPYIPVNSTAPRRSHRAIPAAISPNVSASGSALRFPATTLFRLGLLAAALSLPIEVSAKLITYAAPPGITANNEYAVKINGRRCFTYDVYVDPSAWKKDDATYEHAGMVNFSTDESLTVEVTVAASRPLRSARVRPISRGINATIRGQTIRFKLPAPHAPVQVVLELNGEIFRPLHIFANPLETEVPSDNDPTVFNIEPSTRLRLNEVEELIAAHPEKRIVRFGPGLYAGVDAHGQPAGFRISPPRDGITFYFDGNAYVKAGFVVERNNITIRGRGIIDKTQDLGYLPKGSHLPCDGANNISLDGFILLNPKGWTIRLFNLDQARVHNVKIIGHRLGGDGCDPIGAKNVQIRHCFFRTGDDCVAVKSDRDLDTENILVEHCVFWKDIGAGGACAFGDRTDSDTLRNVTFRDIDILHPYSAAIGGRVEHRATVSNLLFEDIRIEHPRDRLDNREPGLLIHLIVKEDATGTIDGVVFRRIRYLDVGEDLGRAISLLSGASPAGVKNVVFEDCTWLGKKIEGDEDLRLLRQGQVEKVSYR